MLASGKVTFYPNCEYIGHRQLVSHLSRQNFEVDARCRLVDAHYLSPHIPADTPPPFGVADGARVVAVNELVKLGAAPPLYVIVGAGKTATDACIWLLSNDVDPDSICWVRPRDPWMLNRALVQPDPAVFIGMAADIFAAAAAASSVDDLFFRLEEAGVMLRIDKSVTPTMAKTPTLATWELDLLRTIENVVRRGHIRHVEPGRLVFDNATVAIPKDALIVHCAASGLRYPPLVPIWGSEAITLQLVRTSFPCFGAALAGYVEATRHNDVEKNRVCPPSPYSNSTTDWARMQVLGTRAAKSFGTEPDIKQWADQVRLNPARIPPDATFAGDLTAALERYQIAVEPGSVRMARLAGHPETKMIFGQPQPRRRTAANELSLTPCRPMAWRTRGSHSVAASTSPAGTVCPGNSSAAPGWQPSSVTPAGSSAMTFTNADTMNSGYGTPLPSCP